MTTFIGFLELFAWVAVVLAIAAGVTYAMIRLFPGRSDKPAQADSSTTPSDS